MPRIITIIEFDKALNYLNSRGILSQYKKAKAYLLSGNTEKVKLKLRRPKSEAIFQFRITKKYRAYGYFEKNKFIVFKISDHQDS